MWRLLAMDFYRIPQAAVVSRGVARPDMTGRYLQLDSQGSPQWTHDPEAATVFESMREAMRAATRLPAALRAYGLPLRAEVSIGQSLH
jgi:hypothetical protein